MQGTDPELTNSSSSFPAISDISDLLSLETKAYKSTSTCMYYKNFNHTLLNNKPQRKQTNVHVCTCTCIYTCSSITIYKHVYRQVHVHINGYTVHHSSQLTNAFMCSLDLFIFTPDDFDGVTPRIITICYNNISHINYTVYTLVYTCTVVMTRCQALSNISPCWCIRCSRANIHSTFLLDN